MISSEYKQLHFEVYEIELPYCSVCTPREDVQGVWNTPLTCEESSDSTYKLYFTKNSSPIIRQPSQAITGNSYLNSSIFKCVSSANETTPLLKAGRGLASRSTMSVSMTDFKGDPGPLNVSDSGTFFGKLLARNVLEGKQIKTYYYTKDNTQPEPYIVKTSTHYITAASLSGGMFKLSGKDGLKDIEKNSQKYPKPTDLRLTSAIDAITTQIPYEGDNVTFLADNVIKIGRELMQVVSSSPGFLTVQTRGRVNPITKFGEVISTTEASSHQLGDSIQKCLPQNSDIDIVLLNIFAAAGILQFANFSQWQQEVDSWNAGAKIKGVFHEPEDCIDVLNKILSDYTLDMYLDQNTNKAVLSSVSQWLVPTIEPVEEGNDFTGYKEQTLNNERFSRAFIKVVKPNQTDNDDLTNYERIALFTDLETETSDFYGDIKTEQFEPSQTLQFTDAQVLVSRYVKRYSVPPKKIMFNMEERKISNIELGDVIDIRARDKQLYDGTREEAFNRAQVIKIQPKFNGIGRTYDVTAMSYIPESPDDLPPLIFDSGSTTTINIYNQLNNPNVAVNITVILLGTGVSTLTPQGTYTSDSPSSPAIEAGALASGSNVRIICAERAFIGGCSGKGGSVNISNSGVISVEDGEDGSYFYDSNGIASTLYLNGAGTIDGYLVNSQFKSGAGGGGAAATSWSYDGETSTQGVAGGGGSGLSPGISGTLNNPNGFPISFEDDGASTDGSSGNRGSGGDDDRTIFGPGGSKVECKVDGGNAGSTDSNIFGEVFPVDGKVGEIEFIEDFATPSISFQIVGQGGASGGRATGGNINIIDDTMP